MASKTLTLVAAMARNRAIGLAGRMPWHLPGELQHFKRTTLGKPVVMGRRTWESIGRPLPGRQNIVVTRSTDYRAEGADCAGSLPEAVALANGPEIMVIGGGELYRLALPLATRMVLTVIDCAPEADTWFPRWAEDEWERVSAEAHAADSRDALAYEIREYARLNA